jgi:pimeloyl-ACP methyl ester carboxylesterase
MTIAVGKAATITRRQRARRIAFRIVRSALVVYLTVILVMSLLQTKLIFMGAATQGRADSVVTPPPGSELLHLTAADGTKIAALFASPRKSDGSPLATNNLPTVIYFYGNAMCLNDALGEVQMFRSLGANVLAVEYAGFGMSGGKPSEQGCYLAAETAYQHLLTRTDIDPHKLIPAGWSLGGAVAIDLASRHAGEGHICGVMTFSTFTSMVDVARCHYPGVPVSLLLQHRFLSDEKIGSIRVPLLLCHGRQDDIAPFKMSDRLAATAEKAGVPITRLILDHAAHNDFFIQDEARVESAVAQFLKQF